MITLHDALHATIDDLERSFDSAPRPNLHAAARRHRTTVRVASGAAASAAGLGLGLGGFATWQLAIDGPLAAGPGAQATTELGPSLGDPGSSQAPAPVYDFAGEFVVATPDSEITVEGVRVDVYVDAMCPYCAVFAREYEGAVLEREGVTLVVHPIAFLDRFSSDGDFSTRAASAVTQVAVEAPEFAYAFLEQYWEQQPAEGGTLSDQDLMLIAAEAGVPSEVWTTFPEHRYADVVTQATQTAADSGVTWAPYVVVDGVVIETEGDLGLAVDEALDAAFAAR